LEVSVVEGKVLISSHGKEEYLSAGQTANLSTVTENIEVKNAVDINSMGYATHHFQFKNTSLADVFQSIEKSYPCSIEVSNKTIENCRLNATFEEDSVENILSLIAKTLDLSVTKDGQTFVLQGKGCP
jgi:transmembrane sensor